MYPLKILYSLLFVGTMSDSNYKEECLLPGRHSPFSHTPPFRSVCISSWKSVSSPSEASRDFWNFSDPYSNIGYQLFSESFGLAKDEDGHCTDYLSIGGVDEMSNGAQFCGQDSSGFNSSTSSTTNMTIEHYSGKNSWSNSRGYAGFKLWLRPYGLCSGDVEVPPHGIARLVSPDYPGLYEDDEPSCAWQVVAQRNCAAIKFHFIESTLTATSRHCTGTYLELRYNNHSHPNDSLPLCRNLTGNSYSIHANDVTVLFHTDSLQTDGRFVMEINCSAEEATPWSTALPGSTRDQHYDITQPVTAARTPAMQPDLWLVLDNSIYIQKPSFETSIDNSTDIPESTTNVPPPMAQGTSTKMTTLSPHESAPSGQYSGSSTEAFTEAFTEATSTVTALTSTPSAATTTNSHRQGAVATTTTWTEVESTTTHNIIYTDRYWAIAGTSIFLLLVVALALVCRYRRKWRRTASLLRAKCEKAKHMVLGDRDWQQSTSRAPLFIPLPKECEPYIIHPRQLKKSETFLGKGEHGLVYKGSALGLLGKNGATDVAVKTLLLSGTTANAASAVKFVKEVTVMLQTGQHLNLVNLLGVINRGRPCMLLEYCAHGNLLSYLRDCHSSHLYDPSELTMSSYLEINVEKVDLAKVSTQRVFDGSELLKFAYQIARGMQYLASRSIIHRDLAARNVLVAEHGILKISDFGMAKQIESVYVAQDSSAALPVRWMPPEAISTLSFSLASDIWSYGIVLWEIFTQGKVPYAEMTITGQVKVFNQWLLDGNTLSQPADTPDSIYQLMKACWNLSPEKRPSFFDIRKFLDKSISKQAIATYLQLDAPYEYMNLVSQEMHIKLYQNTLSDTVL